MIETRWKIWGASGAAVLVGAALAACGEPAEVAAPAPAPAAAVGEAGEAASGESGGEAGEAGAQDAYAGVEGGARAALRLQHIKGFLLLADRLLREGDVAGASVLTQQGLLEIVDPAPEELGGVDFTALRTAATAGPAAFTPAVRKALTDIDAAQATLGGVDAGTVGRMLALTRGLYGVVIQDGFVDPIEYQHSLGAALGAADALSRLKGDTEAAGAEMDKLLAMWPKPVAPETPTPTADVLAQTSRVELALAGL